MPPGLGGDRRLQGDLHEEADDTDGSRTRDELRDPLRRPSTVDNRQEHDAPGREQQAGVAEEPTDSRGDTPSLVARHGEQRRDLLVGRVRAGPDDERERAVHRVAVRRNDVPRHHVRAVAETVTQTHCDGVAHRFRVVLVDALAIGVQHSHTTELQRDALTEPERHLRRRRLDVCAVGGIRRDELRVS